MASKPEILHMRPYARLLTMLGEQLIKNERIALIELVKNSYDADADWVKISFLNFGEYWELTPESKIIIEDNGHGMTEEIIKNHWVNPATPEKKIRKQTNPRTKKKKRIIQGEKGIGRFSLLKLGSTIEIFTRPEKENVEHVIKFDLSSYDEEFLTENGQPKELFIDDIPIAFESRPPQEINKHKIKLGTRQVTQKNHGTIIEISNLKEGWSQYKAQLTYEDLAKLQSIFPQKGRKITGDFQVYIYKDEEIPEFTEMYAETLSLLLDEKPVFKITQGRYDQKKEEFRYHINGQPKVLKLNDPDISKMLIFKNHFVNRLEQETWKKEKKLLTNCGSFDFQFYIFDFSSQAPLKFKLHKGEKLVIKPHRIYLYRDDIRVFPYGDQDDDWLQIDQYRGTIAAGHFLSNDQVVGVVNISQNENPALQDKTNREGLIEKGHAKDDFVILLKLFLRYIRKKPYAQYRIKAQDKTAHDILRTRQLEKQFDLLREELRDQPKATKILADTENLYRKERNHLVYRAEVTEDLAGVGLSVEMASHDLMSIMSTALRNLDGIISDLLHDDVDLEALKKEITSIRGALSFIENQIEDIQLLFRSSKQRRKKISVHEILEKVETIYKRILHKKNIKLEVEKKGSPLIAKTTDAVILQLFINLFDNAIYWLDDVDKSEKKIKILLDGDSCQLTFADNGPGVKKDDIPYIFEPFYSGKGEEGRGLGLYIARQLLERSDYTIDLANIKVEQILSGANFVVNFVAEEG